VFGVFRGYTFNLISAYFRLIHLISAGFRISGEVRTSVQPFFGKSLLQDKLEKNGISLKTWSWPIFQIGKFELAASQNDPAEIERNRAMKFLQFLENLVADAKK